MTRQRLDPGMAAQLKAFQSGAPLPFRSTLRGYNRRQVEEYLRGIAGLIGTMAPPPIERPAFTIVMRGYDRAEVDEFLDRLFVSSSD